MINEKQARDAILNKLKTGKNRVPTVVRHSLPPSYGHPQKFLDQLAANGAETQHAKDTKDALRKIELIKKEHGWIHDPVTALSIKRTMADYRQQTIEKADLSPPGCVAITQAYCGIADTGSLVCLSSQDNPTSYNFLAEHHIVLLQKDRIMQRKYDVWALMREEDIEIPRAINIISGPSRTADIEQTIQLGAHGPRSLIVFLIG